MQINGASGIRAAWACAIAAIVVRNTSCWMPGCGPATRSSCTSRRTLHTTDNTAVKIAVGLASAESITAYRDVQACNGSKWLGCTVCL